MIRAVIVEDEPRSCRLLRQLLDRFGRDVEVVAEAGTTVLAVEAIRETKPELVFLDIEMPGGSGFDVIRECLDIEFDVIVTTAYDQYAIRAIRLSAIDYLLKPIDIEELRAALDRFREKREKADGGATHLPIFLENLGLRDRLQRRLALPSSDGTRFVRIDQILRLEAADNYTRIFLRRGEEVLVSRTLKDFEELLDDCDFLRVHNSHLVNLAAVARLVKSGGGYLIMSDGTRIEVARRRRDELARRLEKLTLG